MLPAAANRRERVAEARALIALLPPADQRIWATAMYAELRALTADGVDLSADLIAVSEGWDPRNGAQAPKSEAGRRKVPIVGTLRPFLEAALRERCEGLLFGRAADVPFVSTSLQPRADRIWTLNGLRRITLQECRHSYTSLAIAAGANAKTLQEYMGHSTVAYHAGSLWASAALSGSLSPGWTAISTPI
jgi:integrase